MRQPPPPGPQDRSPGSGTSDPVPEQLRQALRAMAGGPRTTGPATDRPPASPRSTGRLLGRRAWMLIAAALLCGFVAGVVSRWIF